MGFLGSLGRSLSKSRKLRKLQLRISPPDRQDEEALAELLSSFRSGADDSGVALEEFLDLCVSDEGVRKVMGKYQLGRDDLREIYWQLAGNGLGQWIKGHFAAASTIAYFEPLYFYVESARREVPLRAVLGKLLLYWDGTIRQGQLIRDLGSPGEHS